MIPMQPSQFGEYLTIDELEKRAGFKLVLPSFLPTRQATYMATWEEYVHGDDQSFQASVEVWRSSAEPTSPDVEINEWATNATESQSNDAALQWGEDPDFGDVSATIGDTSVFCALLPLSHPLPPGLPLTPVAPHGESHPELICRWEQGEFHVVASFRWRLSETLPNRILDEMREEAMQVVRSMIAAPYTH